MLKPGKARRPVGGTPWAGVGLAALLCAAVAGAAQAPARRETRRLHYTAKDQQTGRLWDVLLRQGRRIVGVGTSDWHRGTAPIGNASVRVRAALNLLAPGPSLVRGGRRYRGAPPPGGPQLLGGR